MYLPEKQGVAVTTRAAVRRPLAYLALGVALVLAGTLTPAQQPPTDRQDPEFAKLVREWTTRPEFLSPLVDHLPAVPGIASPKDVLGHHVGAPRTLSYYTQILDCYRALAAGSPRVK